MDELTCACTHDELEHALGEGICVCGCPAFRATDHPLSRRPLPLPVARDCGERKCGGSCDSCG